MYAKIVEILPLPSKWDKKFFFNIYVTKCGQNAELYTFCDHEKCIGWSMKDVTYSEL
jgi:hypothetical protein